jgi:hypothetical protein
MRKNYYPDSGFEIPGVKRFLQSSYFLLKQQKNVAWEQLQQYSATRWFIEMVFASLFISMATSFFLV